MRVTVGYALQEKANAGRGKPDPAFAEAIEEVRLFANDSAATPVVITPFGARREGFECYCIASTSVC